MITIPRLGTTAGVVAAGAGGGGRITGRGAETADVVTLTAGSFGFCVDGVTGLQPGIRDFSGSGGMTISGIFVSAVFVGVAKTALLGVVEIGCDVTMGSGAGVVIIVGAG